MKDYRKPRSSVWAGTRYQRGLLALLTILSTTRSESQAIADTEADRRELQSVAYLAVDRDVGSYLQEYPGQRVAFGMPLEPISALAGRRVSLPDFEGELLSEIVGFPLDIVVEEYAPPEVQTGLFALDFIERQREFGENPYDLAAVAKVVSAILQGAATLAEESRFGLFGAVAAAALDRGVQVGELVRSCVMQHRALAQSQLPLGVQRDAGSVLQERIDKRGGAFWLEGRELRAQGGWQLDHSSGPRSLAYARYDFQDEFLPSGALISTTGTAPPPLPLLDAEDVKPGPLDGILNWIGRESNWIGRNVTGGKTDNLEVDAWGQYTLGDTRVGGKDLYDCYARLHDIEYYVSTHFPEGTEVRVPTADGYEYFTSEGNAVQANLRVIARVLAATTFNGLINALITHDYQGRQKPLTDDVVDLHDTSRRVAPTHAVDRVGQLQSTPGGMFRSVEVQTTAEGVRVTTKTRESYSIRYDGAAVSAAVEEYNRTGVYDLAKHYGLAQASQRRDPPRPRANINTDEPKREPVKRDDQHDDDDDDNGTGGGGGDDGGGGGGGGGSGGGGGGWVAHLPKSDGRWGGVSLRPNNVYTADGSGWIDSLANAARSAADTLPNSQSLAQIQQGGETFIVARAGRSRGRSVPAPRPPGQAGIGRFVFYQTDLALRSETGWKLVLQRFFDSSAAGTRSWSWLPFELVLNEGQATLIDRQAALQIEYHRGADGIWRRVRPRGGSGPTLEATDLGGFRVRFAHDFEVAFDPSGKPVWSGSPKDSSDRMRFGSESGRLARIEGNGVGISLEYDAQGRLTGARTADGQAVAYHWDAAGRLDGVTGPSGAKVLFGYDNGGRVVSVRAEGEAPAVITNRYDEVGRLLAEVYKLRQQIPVGTV